ncbi:hypothetical protein G7Y89_g2843 [Cudoniella acicularis]|uniref:Uncharacterized protein n=1 Tax=Cudoniella acicularis TaxID=354080 RepID=A0A8H4W6J6_9HELO|nr:hypothetical protein G7Y89_g2843 [Cudoniella acicularis]
MTSMLLAIITAPALLATNEAIRQGQTKDRREEHRARRSNLVVSCVDSSEYSLEIDHRQVGLKQNRLFVKTDMTDSQMHPFAGYYLPYPDAPYEGLVSTITNIAPIMNWIYVDRETYQVKYGVRTEAQPNITGPFDCTRQDRRLTLEKWEGFVAVKEEEGPFAGMWGLYFDRDDDGLKGKLGRGRIVLEVELVRWEKRVKKDAPMDTSRDGLHSPSPRNSYASTTDSEFNSARNSYTSISDSIPSSSRTSYSSIPEALGRVLSFSRTSDSFIPDSVASTPLTSRDSSPDSPRWAKRATETMAQPNSPRFVEKDPPNELAAVAKDGMTTLRDLKNVQNVLCVAFGAFDRFYISWEDIDNQFHQESNKLPESLHRWLFPEHGGTRHLPSLQVSFGSNDDFFASDKFGKLSSRDANVQPSDSKPVPKLADVARTPESPKLERRRTFMGAQPAPIINAEPKLPAIPAGEQLLTRLGSKAEMPSAEHRRRRSILVGVPPVRSAWPEKKTILMAKDRILAERALEAAAAAAPPTPARTRYVDASVQTEIVKEPCQPVSAQVVLHNVPMGSMQDFFRGQYSLGDALRYPEVLGSQQKGAEPNETRKNNSIPKFDTTHSQFSRHTIAKLGDDKITKMAEVIGTVSSILGIATIGAQTSLILYDLASTIGSAKRDELFEDITEVVAKLQSSKDVNSESGGKEMNYGARVKWIFKREKVQRIQAELESMKLMLHLMLTTLDFARKMSLRRESGINHTLQTDAEDQEAHTVAASLIVAQKSAEGDLETIELETLDEEDINEKLELPEENVSDQQRIPLHNKRNTQPFRAFIWISSPYTVDTSSVIRPATWTATPSNTDTRQVFLNLLKRWTNCEAELDKLKTQSSSPPSYSSPLINTSPEPTTQPQKPSPFVAKLLDENSVKPQIELKSDNLEEIIKNALADAEAEAASTGKEGEPALVALGLSGRSLTSIPSEISSPDIANRISRLALSHNLLKGLSTTDFFLNLRYLNMRNNRIKTFPLPITALTKLEILDLAKNKITSLPDEIIALQNLKVFCIQNNCLAQAPTI